MDCPDWICNEQDIPYDYIYFIGTILISIPYFLAMYYLYRTRIAEYPRKVRYLFFMSLPITAFLYSAALFYAFLDSRNAILSFVGVLSYGPIMILILPFYLSIIGMIVLGFIKFKEE